MKNSRIIEMLEHSFICLFRIHSEFNAVFSFWGYGISQRIIKRFIFIWMPASSLQLQKFWKCTMQNIIDLISLPARGYIFDRRWCEVKPQPASCVYNSFPDWLNKLALFPGKVMKWQKLYRDPGASSAYTWHFCLWRGEICY